MTYTKLQLTDKVLYHSIQIVSRLATRFNWAHLLAHLVATHLPDGNYNIQKLISDVYKNVYFSTLGHSDGVSQPRGGDPTPSDFRGVARLSTKFLKNDIYLVYVPRNAGETHLHIAQMWVY